jgi:hypothetical protein
MRFGRAWYGRRRWGVALLGIVAAVLLALVTVPGSALAEEALIAEPTAPSATERSAGPTEVSTQYVEDPTRMAGGEDDAVRAYERQEVRRRDSDGGDDKRRK